MAIDPIQLMMAMVLSFILIAVIIVTEVRYDNRIRIRDDKFR